MAGKSANHEGVRRTHGADEGPVVGGLCIKAPVMDHLTRQLAVIGFQCRMQACRTAQDDFRKPRVKVRRPAGRRGVRVVGPAQLDPIAMVAAFGPAMDGPRHLRCEARRGGVGQEQRTLLVRPVDMQGIDVDRERKIAGDGPGRIWKRDLLLQNIRERQADPDERRDLVGKRPAALRIRSAPTLIVPSDVSTARS